MEPQATLKITLPRPDKGLAVLAARNAGMTLDEWAARWITHAAQAELDQRPKMDEWMDVYDSSASYALKTTLPRCLVNADGMVLIAFDPMTEDQKIRAGDEAMYLLDEE
jgi:hypothetical protein